MSSSSITDKDLIAFRAISSFVDELSSIFEKKQHPLKLYKRLITKTTLNHESAIVKHIETFKAFCIDNRDPIKNRNISKLEGRIEYSARVFIDLKEIMSDQENDTETIDAIWNHMLAISAIVDPENKTKEILKKRMKKAQRGGKSSSSNGGGSDLLSSVLGGGAGAGAGAGGGNAMGLISSLMGSLQGEIGKSGALNESEGDPLKLISSIMSSGVFTKLLGQVSSGLKDQNVDISELMGATQSMFSNMQANGNQVPDMQNIISSVMTGLAQPATSSSSDNKEEEGVVNSIDSTSTSTQPTSEKLEEIVANSEEPTSTTIDSSTSLSDELVVSAPLTVVEPLDESVEFHQN